jgi:hypothetical protein
LGNYIFALDDCNYALELDADFDLAYAARGSLYYRLGESYYLAAVADYEYYAEISGEFEPYMETQIAEMRVFVEDCHVGLCHFEVEQP